MCRWYQKAQVCYAYLPDVPFTSDWLTAFRGSLWFTRGWTLQELLAPSTVQFFDNQWQFIGDKKSLADNIESITKIPKDALREKFKHLPQVFSIAQRMSWAAMRQTSRVEDAAYCLMGLFDINMPLLYGEGSKAFRRLQEEIIEGSNDETILAWNKAFTQHNVLICNLLVSSPADFVDCAGTIRGRNDLVGNKIILYKKRLPYVLTHGGLQITGCLLEQPRRDFKIMLLNCTESSDARCPFVMILRGNKDDYDCLGCIRLNLLQVGSYLSSKLPPLRTVFLANPKRRFFDYYLSSADLQYEIDCILKHLSSPESEDDESEDDEF